MHEFSTISITDVPITQHYWYGSYTAVIILFTWVISNWLSYTLYDWYCIIYSDESVRRNKKSEKKTKKKLRDDRSSDAKLKHKKTKKSHSSSHGNKRLKRDDTDKNSAG